MPQLDFLTGAATSPSWVHDFVDARIPAFAGMTPVGWGVA